MAIIVNFDTTTLEALSSALDAAVAALGVAQTAEAAAEAGVNSSDTTLTRAVEVLCAPASEFAVAQRLQRQQAVQSALVTSGNAALTAASAAVAVALADVEAARTDLTAYVASII